VFKGIYGDMGEIGDFDLGFHLELMIIARVNS
jgi:hypothetical protein